MRLAHIFNGIVINMSAPPVGYIAGDGEVLLPADSSVGIGWTYGNGEFAPPSVAPEPEQPVPPSWSDPGLDPRYHWVDVGRFNARLGPDAMAIAASTHDACRAAVALLGMSKYANLRGPELGQMLDILIATNQPAANPIFPGSGPMTPAKKAVILNPVTTEYERHIKGMVQPV